MNRLDTSYNGGFPHNLNDLRFVDDAIRLAFQDILKGLAGSTPVIIWGCTATPLEPEGHNISEGAVFYQGEIWHVDSHNIGEYGDAPDWAFFKTYDPDGNKIYKDGQQHNTYEVRKAKQYGLSGQPSGTIYSTSATNIKQLKDIFFEASWSNPTLLNNTEIISGSSLVAGKIMRRINLQGQIRVPILSDSIEVLSVPQSFKPVTPVSALLPCKVGGTSNWINLRCQLGSDGKLRFYSDTTLLNGIEVDLAISYLSV